MRTTTQRPSQGAPLVTHKALDVPDQTGMLAVVTGANSGIGFGSPTPSLVLSPFSLFYDIFSECTTKYRLP